jgi:hypothetical protein
MKFDSLVLPAHSRPKSGAAKLVVGPATSRRKPLAFACVAAINLVRATQDKDVNGRNKPGHDEPAIPYDSGIPIAAAAEPSVARSVARQARRDIADGL